MLNALTRHLLKQREELGAERFDLVMRKFTASAAVLGSEVARAPIKKLPAATAIKEFLDYGDAAIANINPHYKKRQGRLPRNGRVAKHHAIVCFVVESCRVMVGESISAHHES